MDPSLPEGRLPDALENTTAENLPKDMTFNESHVLTIAVYSVLIVVGATGNITVLSLLRRRGAPRTRINNMLVHLAIADLLVSVGCPLWPVNVRFRYASLSRFWQNISSLWYFRVVSAFEYYIVLYVGNFLLWKIFRLFSRWIRTWEENFL